jgi:WD40 repeat protein
VTEGDGIEPMRVWQAHERAVLALAFTPDGGLLATAGEGDPAVRLWDVAATAERRQFSLFKETAVCLAFAPDGRTLAAGWPWSIQLWDVAADDPRLRLEGHRHFSASLAIAADGSTLLSAGRRLGGHTPDAVQAVIFGLDDGRVRAEFVGPVADSVTRPVALDAATILWDRPAAPKADPVATVTDVPTGRPRAVLTAPGPVRAAALAPGSGALAAAVRGDVHLWATPAEMPAPTVGPPPRPRWDPRRWLHRPARPAGPTPLTPAQTLLGAAERLDVLAFTPDGRTILAGGAAGTVRVWPVPELAPPTNGEPPPASVPGTALQWGVGPVTALAVAPDGLTAAVGGGTGRVVVWDVDG